MTFESEIEVNNGLGQQGDALIPRPELPPRLTASVQRSPPPYVSNQNIFAVLLRNKRQITSLTAGLYTEFHMCVFLCVTEYVSCYTHHDYVYRCLLILKMFLCY